MAKPLDPDTLRSLADIARLLGYNPNYLGQLAAEQRFAAWKFGKTWVSTVEIVKEYVRGVQPVGRPKGKPASKTNEITEVPQ